MVSIKRSDGFHMVSQNQATRPVEIQKIYSMVVVETSRDTVGGWTVGQENEEDHGAGVTLPRLTGFGMAGEQ